MAADQPIIGTSIVLVGAFNPRIIHPAWFARYEVLPPSDLENLEEDQGVTLVSPDYTRFAISWLRVQVTSDHFELSTVEDDRVLLLRDATVNIFRLLTHTPVSAMGINRTAHFPLPPGRLAQAWSSLTRPEIWEEAGEPVTVNSYTVQAERKDPDDPGYVRVTVEPSQNFEDGLFVAVNDHHDLTTQSDVKEASPVLGVLDSGWSEAIARHKSYSQFVLDVAEGK